MLCFKQFARTILICVGTIECLPLALAQETNTGFEQRNKTDSADSDASSLLPAAKVEISPLAMDSEIQTRLADILRATTWFNDSRVEVEEGIVTLTGSTQLEQHKTWAGDLARNTQDVVAVINRISVKERAMWDLTPAWKEVRRLGRETIQMLPLLVLAILLMTITWFCSGWSVALSSRVLSRRIDNPLLVNVLSRTIAIPVFLVGLYLALRVSGLTQIAATVIGGTGLLGLILGIAFRDIAENFLASILISIQRPFALGDQIRVDGNEGIVQSVTTRGTLLMTLDGNHVQIPNSSIYKSVIRNMTANPTVRGDFMIGIGFGDSISLAQEIVLKVLKAHEAVLQTPDPLVLVEELGSSTVKLRVYFWISSQAHSLGKVKSSIIRLTKAELENAGLSIPDESREIVFPNGVPVILRREPRKPAAIDSEAERQKKPTQHEATTRVSEAENNLSSEHDEINRQARQSRNPEEGINLLKA